METFSARDGSRAPPTRRSSVSSNGAIHWEASVMRSHLPTRRRRNRSGSSLCRYRKFLRAAIEPLEDRVMLDGGVGASNSLPPAIVVGRTLSSYTVGGIQNNQETITYTVYNEQANPETGVLLTDTLSPGETILSSSVTLDGTTTAQLPDQSGQNLAWSLQPINGYDRESVSVTVSLPSPTPLQLDTGAQAFATLDAGAVSNATPAATLRPGTVDPSLLASTPDANTTDPFIQEEAAKLNYDPQQIFNFLHTQIGYNSYTGSLRGARGTLWSSAGNALDVASLGVALDRASGIPAQYVQGTLSQDQASQLILSMFPNSFQTVGYIPAGTQTADPANDPQLQSETQNHYWFQFDAGSGFKDADPLMAGAHDRPDVHDIDGHVHRGAGCAAAKDDRPAQRGDHGYPQQPGWAGSQYQDRPGADLQRRRSGGQAPNNREFRQHHHHPRAVLRGHHEYLFAIH